MPERVTEGNIAIDDDLTTPVFSPYSGRVIRLIAKLGDHVARGQPLMAVAASEFVQGQNDLVTAAASLKTTRAQLKLAETAEQRQHALYLAKGGALKDWQQSQADLATAQNSLRAQEIALAAVRNRLRILGKSDREIDAIENGAPLDMEPVAYIVAPISGTVTQRQVGLGQNILSVQSGASTPVYTIGDLSTVWLVANVREADAPLIRIGQAGRSAGAGLSRAGLQGEDFLDRPVDRRQHASPAGARRCREPGRGVEAADVRALQHHHRAGRHAAGGARECDRLRRRHGSGLGRAQRNDRRARRSTSARPATAWSRCWAGSPPAKKS